MNGRLVPIVAALSLAVAGSLAAGGTATATAPSKAQLVPTPYAMGASGYASRVIGGDIPANSDRTAFAVVGCTNDAGRSVTNSQASSDMGGNLKLTSTETHAWTTKRGNTVSSFSTHSIGKVTLLDLGLASVYLKGITAQSHAWHSATGFHSASSSSLGSITLDPIIGDNVNFPIPSPGQKVTIPGIAEISLGLGTSTSSGAGATTVIDGVKIKSLLDDTIVTLAHTKAKIRKGVSTQLYRGSAYGSQTSLLGGAITSGRTPNTIVPCGGTGGKKITHTTASANLVPGLPTTSLTVSHQSGLNKQGRPFVTTTSRVGRANLGGGLIITGITARAHINRTRHGFAMNTAGSGNARVVLNGQVQEIPLTDLLQLPGVAKIEQNIVTKTKRTISVTALRITLLDGSLGVINLGYAKAGLAASGL